MFVLGIDPGLTRCGFGLVEGSFEGLESFRAVRAGVVETDPKEDVERRLSQLFVELRTLITDTTPDAVVVERIFYQRNAKDCHTRRPGERGRNSARGSLELPVRQFTAQTGETRGHRLRRGEQVPGPGHGHAPVFVERGTRTRRRRRRTGARDYLLHDRAQRAALLEVESDVIGWLSGRVVHQHLTGAIVLDVNGVGYELSVSSSTSYRVGEEVSLFVYTVVRADAIQLYGFSSYADREFFELLLITPGSDPRRRSRRCAP